MILFAEIEIEIARLKKDKERVDNQHIPNISISSCLLEEKEMEMRVTELLGGLDSSYSPVREITVITWE